jgi:HPt (histidine-containing phosphotransfer) domain-containing protein
MPHETTAYQCDLLAGIEPSEITGSFQGDRDLLHSLIELFREQTPLLMSEIQRGLSGNDASIVRRAAHTLKGSTAIFGTTAAFEAARQLEAAASSGKIERAAAAFECVSLTQFELDDAFDHILRAG